MPVGLFEVNMKSAPENFDQLLKLFALKRHEQPPPGYFENFPSQIMARLKSGEARKRGWWEDFSGEVSWLQSVWSALEAKPILAGAFGVVVSGLVLSGIIYSQKMDQAFVPPNPAAAESMLAGAPKAWTFDRPETTILSASTNPVAEPKIPGSLFDGFRPLAQPVNFEPKGN